MLARLKLAANVLLFGVGFTVLGGMSDPALPLVGMAVGGAFGILIGLAFGGRSKWLEYLLCGPEDKDREP
jgi:hypothetical protein